MRAHRNYALDVMIVIISTHMSYVCTNYAYIPCVHTLVSLHIYISYYNIIINGWCMMVVVEVKLYDYNFTSFGLLDFILGLIIF
jgi:hypothetical protein